MKIIMKSCIVVLAVLLMLPVMAASDEQLLPLLEMWVDPGKLVVQQPCPPTQTDTLWFRNNSLSVPITVDWSSVYLIHALECVADYTPKSGTVGPIPPLGKVSEIITLSFLCDCEGRTTIKFSGVVQGNPGDTDSDTLQVVCPRHYKVPSHTNLGLLILIALLLGSGMYVAYRRRVREV